MKRKPRVYFSFRSPYSWLALARLRDRAPRAFSQLELIPFWDPDPDMRRDLEARGGVTHYVQMSKAKHLYILRDVRRITQQAEMSMRWPIDVDPWWEVPHLGWLLAKRSGKADAFYDAVIEARWTRGENVCDSTVIASAAAAAGLDPVAVASAASCPALRREAVDCLMEASDDDVFGVPYFRVGRDRYWGLDRVALVAAALDPACDSLHDVVGLAPHHAYDHELTGPRTSTSSRNPAAPQR